MKKLDPKLIAPCGMNCALCVAYQREQNKCSGCNYGATIFHCQKCALKICAERRGVEFCFDCDKFPCQRLKNLDKRYRLKYNMSEIENLIEIKDVGIEEFVKNQEEKWRCPKCGNLICCHKGVCLVCNL